MAKEQEKLHSWRFPFRKKKRIIALEKRVDELSNSIEILNTKNYDLEKKLKETKSEKEQLDKEYAQLENKLSSIANILELRNHEHANLKKRLLETNNSLQESKKKLDIVETDKNKIKAQLKELQTTYSKSTKTGRRATLLTMPGERTHDKGKSREGIIKETQEKLKSSLIEGLLDKAIALYRLGKFEQAIAKWEEVLSYDPNKFEAKYNIEIAQDRIKERQGNLEK